MYLWECNRCLMVHILKFVVNLGKGKKHVTLFTIMTSKTNTVDSLEFMVTVPIFMVIGGSPPP